MAPHCVHAQELPLRTRAFALGTGERKALECLGRSRETLAQSRSTGLLSNRSSTRVGWQPKHYSDHSPFCRGQGRGPGIHVVRCRPPRAWGSCRERGATEQIRLYGSPAGHRYTRPHGWNRDCLPNRRIGVQADPINRGKREGLANPIGAACSALWPDVEIYRGWSRSQQVIRSDGQRLTRSKRQGTWTVQEEGSPGGFRGICSPILPLSPESTSSTTDPFKEFTPDDLQESA